MTHSRKSRKLPALPGPRAVTPPATTLDRQWRPSLLAQHWSLPRQTIYALIKKGELKTVTINNALRVTEASAIAYIERGQNGGGQ